MPKYLCIRRTESDRPRGNDRPSPAQMEKMYEAFNAWREQFGDNIADLGGQLTDAGTVLTAEGASDGPFVEAKEVVGGFMILVADSLQQAAEIARGCPGVVGPGGSLEIREIRTS